MRQLDLDKTRTTGIDPPSGSIRPPAWPEFYGGDKVLEGPLLARTYRQSRRRDTSAMAPGSDIPAAMSDFELISSALPPGSDVADSPDVRGLLTHSRPLREIGDRW